MIAHFQSNCSGLHKVEAVTIQGGMMDYFGQDKGTPQYIHTMEAAQARAKQVKLPISNKSLVAIANRAMLSTNKYADETTAWNKRFPDKCTGANWKPIYQEAYTANQCRNTIRG